MGEVTEPKQPSTAPSGLYMEPQRQHLLARRNEESTATTSSVPASLYTEPHRQHLLVRGDGGGAAPIRATSTTAGSLGPPVVSPITPIFVLVKSYIQLVSKLRAVLLLIFMVLALLCAGGILLTTFQTQILRVCAYLEAHSPLSAIYFMGIVALWIMLCFPSTVIETIGGMIFPTHVAILALTCGKQIGCCLPFWIGKFIASDTFRSTLETYASNTLRIRALFLAIEKHPWQTAALLRLVYIPIGIKNYGMACLPLPFYIFATTTLITGLPYTLLWVHLGASCRSLLEAVHGGSSDKKKRSAQIQEISFLAAGITLGVVLILVLGYYTKRYTLLLAAQQEGEDEEVEEEGRDAIFSSATFNDVSEAEDRRAPTLRLAEKGIESSVISEEGGEVDEGGSFMNGRREMAIVISDVA